MLIGFWLLAAGVVAAEPPFVIELSKAHSGFDGRTCWVHARAGAIPVAQLDKDALDPLVVMTTQKLLLTGSDVFYALHETRSDDLGQSWSSLTRIPTFARQTYRGDQPTIPTGAEIAPELLQVGDETTVCDFVPKWHAPSQRLLGIGHTVWYRDNRVMHRRPRGVAYAVYDTDARQWNRWRVVDLPDVPKFKNAGAGSQQRVDLPGGDILLPIYFKAPDEKQYSVTVCRCRFDGETLHYVEHGNEMTIPIQRGFVEPSLTCFGGRYYLTIRNDEYGYVTTSEDGLKFAPPRRWTFDDASDLGNYNTQQHWVAHSDGLFLVYTRRGVENDHVFRHRAPLLIARVDPEKLQVIRDTEQILVPERGARLGNFGVVDVSPTETWVTVTEWMQPAGVEKHGSDNSIYVAKLKWKRPNQLVSTDAAMKRDTAWDTIHSYFGPPEEYQDDYGAYRSPLELPDGSKVRTPEDWQRRRAELLDQWQALLGRWPALVENLDVEILESESVEDFTRHRVRFAWTPEAETIGYLLVPKADGPHPAVVTVFYEPETAIGQGKSHRDFARQLARRGFVTLSIGTAEASQAKTYALYHPSIENAQVAPLSMLGYAAANAWHVLAARDDVDQDRIGIMGHSFGGKWAMFAACLFDKFACAVWSDPGIVFDETRPSINYWEPWYLGYHPPPWRRRGLIAKDNPARGIYPQLRKEGRDLHELHALMAPRPFLVSGGSEDPIERWQALNHTVAINKLLGYESRVAMTNRPDHAPNADSNAIIYAFLEHFLK